MNKKHSNDSYLAIVIIVIIILSISVVFFSKYIEENTRGSIEVSTYQGLDESRSSQANMTSSLQNIAKTGDNPTQSNANDILQLITKSINNPGQVELIYQQFSKEQIPGISEEEYQIYISLLREIIGSEIVSYSTMSYSDVKLISNSMLSHNEKNEEFLKSASFHWLEYYSDAKRTELKRLPIILSRDGEGRSFLSSDWVRGTLELKNFSVLYFASILDKNFESLYRLTYSKTLDDDLRLEKTNALMDFYENYVAASKIGNAQIVSLRMDEIIFELPIYEDKAVNLNQEVSASSFKASSGLSEINKSQSVTRKVKNKKIEVPANLHYDSSEDYKLHTVRIYKSNDAFVAEDFIPSNTWKYDAVLFNETGEVLHIGQEINVQQILEKFSWPEEQYLETVNMGRDKQKQYYRICFADIDLELELLNPDKTVPAEQTQEKELVKFSQDSRFKVCGFKLKSNKYSISKAYKVKQDVEELLDRYLYMDTVNFTYTDDADNVLTMQVGESNTIDAISVSSKEYSDNLLLYSCEEESMEVFGGYRPETASTSTTKNKAK